MSKAFQIELGSQIDIQQEGQIATTGMTVGQRKVDFFIPEITLDTANSLQKGNSKPVQKIVDRVNQYITNIADDYFLLGLHLVSLHKLLKQSKMTTAQIKSWYAENVNMPYSSAMQCRKVAETYQDNPDLIQRYTASGAYLLSSFESPDLRESLWQEARGSKDSPSIRDLRHVIRERKDSEQQANEAHASSPQAYVMDAKKIHDSFKELSKWSKQLTVLTDDDEVEELRHIIVRACKHLVRQMQETIDD